MKLTSRSEYALLALVYLARHDDDGYVSAETIAPDGAPLIATLMLGNLMRGVGVVDRLSKAAQNEIINIATLFLGLAIGSTMTAASFLKTDTLFIMLSGLGAFVLDTVAGLLVGKLMAVVTHGKVNPLIRAAGISVFPMAGGILLALVTGLVK